MKMKDLVITVMNNGLIPQHKAKSNTIFWVYANLRGNNIMIQPHRYLRVPLGFTGEVPSSWVGVAFLAPLVTLKKDLQLVSPLIEIDEDAEWAIYIYNNSDSTQIVMDGEKIAQIMFFKAKECKMLPRLDPSFGKGEKDFGIAGNSDEA